MNTANINTYFGAKWNIEVCKSGENGIESYFPLGEKLKNNMILDHWLESLIYLYSPSGGAVKAYCDNGLSLAGITRGAMHIGAGSIPPNYQQTGLQIPLKSTSYIRPFFNQCTGIYYPESGMAVISKNYDFGIENNIVTYSEAGFRPGIADALPTGKRNWLWSRFVFTKETGVSGYIYANSGSMGITGMDLSGVFVDNNQYDLRKPTDPLYNGLSGLPSFELGWRYNWPENSGMFLIDQSGSTTGFVYNPKNITELVTGFISGYLSGGNFYPFTLSSYPAESSGLSGIYLQDGITNTLYFSSGGFNEFSGFTGKYFNTSSGFQYTGFDQGYSLYGSGFYPTSGILTGSMTGIIGSRNVLKLDGYITGTIGFKNITNPITLSTGEFLKLRYDVYMQIPAIVNPILVTGDDITHGEFNGSGQLKLIGKQTSMFGTIDGDGKVTPGIGIWWPLHRTNYSKYSRSQWDNLAEPNAHLSALMVASGVSGGGVNFNDSFPETNTTSPIVSAQLDDEIRFCDTLEPKIGDCGTGLNKRSYFEKRYYSSKGLMQSPSWPLYSHSGVRVYNYIAHNRPSAIWPKSIDIQMIFPGPYPNQDTGINGFSICGASEGTVCGGRTIADGQGNAYRPEQYIKPTLYENTGAYLDCGLTLPYSAWYYKFNNPQMKYEDQIINLYLTFSLDRITV
jgi:hypothetical protein